MSRIRFGPAATRGPRGLPPPLRRRRRRRTRDLDGRRVVEEGIDGHLGPPTPPAPPPTPRGEGDSQPLRSGRRTVIGLGPGRGGVPTRRGSHCGALARGSTVFLQPGGHGLAVGGVVERRRRKLAQRVDEAGPRPRESRQEPRPGRPPRRADHARVEAVHLGHRFVPDDPVGPAPGDQGQSPGAVLLPGRDVSEHVADRPRVLGVGLLESLAREPGQEGQRRRARPGHAGDGRSTPRRQRLRAPPPDLRPDARPHVRMVAGARSWFNRRPGKVVRSAPVAMPSLERRVTRASPGWRGPSEAGSSGRWRRPSGRSRSSTAKGTARPGPIRSRSRRSSSRRPSSPRWRGWRTASTGCRPRRPDSTDRTTAASGRFAPCPRRPRPGSRPMAGARRRGPS